MKFTSNRREGVLLMKREAAMPKRPRANPKVLGRVLRILFESYPVLSEFFEARGVRLVSLGQTPLFDYGGAVGIEF